MALRAGGLTGLMNQPSAQVIDGSLKIDSSNASHLERTPGSAGNRKTFTFSGWVKKYEPTHSTDQSIIVARTDSPSADGDVFGCRLEDDGRISVYDTGNFYVRSGVGRVRDTTGWYHVFFSVNTTVASNNVKLYLNGDLVGQGTYTQNADTRFNSTNTHRIGRREEGSDLFQLNAAISNYYVIDGQALDPSYFGFTDPLTGTWRPKKYTGTFAIASGTPSVSNGGLVIKADGASINGTFAVNGGVKTWTSPDGVTWTRNGSGRSSAAAKYLAVGGAGTALRTFYPDAGSGGFTFYMYNGGGEFDGSSSPFTLDLSSQTYLPSQTSSFGGNGFYLPMDGNSPIGQDKSGNGNDWTPVNLGGSNSLEKATGALPILNTTPGGVSASVGVRTDAYASSLVLALPLVGSKDDVSNQINSESTTKVVTANGNAAASTTQSNFYGGSFYFDGTGDYAITDANTNDLVINTGDFTLEAWIWNDLTGAYQGILSDRPDGGGGTSINITNSNKIEYYAGGTIYNTPFNVPQQSWHHVAFTRSGGTMYSFFDGVLLDSRSATGDNGDNAGIWNIGRYYYNRDGYYYKGYVQDARVYKGVAKYTSDFVVPSTSPDILPDTPSGVVGGSKLAKITDGAVAFDGSSDSLKAADSSDLAFGTGEFTVEMFFYANTVSGNDVLYDSRAATGNPTDGFSIVRNGDQLRTYTSGAYQITPSTFRVGTKRWYHLAITRESTTQKMYIDGVLVGSATVSNDFSQPKATIGSDVNTGEGWDGFISNFRLIKGTALYTSNFTPPTAPLTNVTNTKLLTCQSPTNVRLSPVGPNVGITTTTRFNSNFESIPTTVNGLTVTNNGSVSTTSAGTNSYGFTNCADLTASNSLSVDLGTIPAVTTIDIIFKATGATDNKYLFGIGGNGMVRRSSSNFAWYNGSDTTISTSEIVDGNWHHLRVTPTRLFFDNTLITNSTSLQFINNNTVSDGDNSGHMALGAFRNGSGTIQYNASVDFGLVRVMPGVDLGAPSSYPITTNGTLSDTETISNDGIIVVRGDAAATNFNPFNTDINTVRGQETGYATWNPLKMGTSDVSMSEGNLFWRTTSNGPDKCTYSTIGMDSGKFYWENEIVEATATAVGIANVHSAQDSGPALAHNWMYYSATGQVYLDGSASSYGAAFNTNGTIIGVAFDRDNLTLEFYKNGISQGKLTSISGLTDSETYFAMCGDSGGASQSQVRVNFGQKPFKFPPPDGFQPLNVANVRPETVITRPDRYVGTTLYTGNNTVGREIDMGRKFDLVWVKKRNTTENHILVDTVRGANNFLMSDSNNAANTSGGPITALNDTSIVVDNNGYVNANSSTYVAWNWRAGGSKGTFNVDDLGYANASDVNMNVGGIRAAVAVSSGNDYSAGYAGHSPVGTWVDSDSWSGLPAYSSGQKGYFSGTETLSNGSVISAAANPKPFNAVANGSQGFVLRASTTVTLKLLVQGNVTEIATTSSDSQTFGNRTIVATNPTSGTYVEATGKCFWWSGNSNYPSISIMGTLYDAPAQPSIPATGCSVGTKQGFSIIKYQGGAGSDTVSHGLTQPPDLLIVKQLNNAGTESWHVMHSALGATHRGYLDTTAAFSDSDDGFGDVNPTSSVFTVAYNGTNKDGADYIAYCWHDVPGLQKFGNYLSEGGNDATYVHLGFRPAILWIKSSVHVADTTSWCIFTDEIDKTNPFHNPLYANNTAEEGKRGNNVNSGTFDIDLLSDGFKIRTNVGEINEGGSGDYYIYCAWAKEPLFNLYGGQSNAR